MISEKVAVFRRKNEEEKALYHYKQCGLDDVYLKSGYDITSTTDGEFVSIRDVDELWLVIGLRLCRERKLLHGKELRFLRKVMDESQADLADHLRVTDQTVARWEKDEVEIPGPADYVIRALFLEFAKVVPVGVRELLRNLRESDERAPSKQVFKPTRDGWKATAACG